MDFPVQPLRRDPPAPGVTAWRRAIVRLVLLLIFAGLLNSMLQHFG